MKACGHKDGPLDKNYRCGCQSCYKLAYHKKHPEKIRKYHRRYKRKRKIADPTYNVLNYKKAHIKRTYGLEWHEYLSLLNKHGNKCAVCGSTNKLSVDHDHQTGRVRGILCSLCNLGIGALGDTLEGVSGAVTYLKQQPYGLMGMDMAAPGSDATIWACTKCGTAFQTEVEAMQHSCLLDRE